MVPEDQGKVGARSGDGAFLLAGAAVATGLAAGIRVLGAELDLEGSLANSCLLGLRAVLVGLGLLAAAIAVVRRPRSALVLGAAACVSALSFWAIEESYDSFRIMLTVLTLVAAAASILVLLPRMVSRVIVSLLVIVHFGGILTAVTSIPPPGAPGMWLNTQIWTRFYRPYLQFMYLTNAYHFYSPEPGPATLLWFRIAYTDGSCRWIKLPNRECHALDPLLLEYYRQLSITENANQNAPVLAVPPDVARRRLLAGEIDGIPAPDEISRLLPGSLPYRMPAGNCQQLLKSYASHVARTYPQPPSRQGGQAGPAAVGSIRIYRVTHMILHPAQLIRGMDARDPTLYRPYYMGEFDRQGNLLDAADPYLYWLIPILPNGGGESESPDRAGITNYLQLHAGSNPLEENP
jgi:hypothetical protein